MDINITQIFSLARQFKKSVSHFCTVQFKTIFLHHKTGLFILIQLFMQHIYIFNITISFMQHIYIFNIALYDKRMVGFHILNDHGNLMIAHGTITEKSWKFIYFLWEPVLNIKLYVMQCKSLVLLFLVRRTDKEGI